MEPKSKVIRSFTLGEARFDVLNKEETELFLHPRFDNCFRTPQKTEHRCNCGAGHIWYLWSVMSKENAEARYKNSPCPACMDKRRGSRQQAKSCGNPVVDELMKRYRK